MVNPICARRGCVCSLFHLFVLLTLTEIYQVQTEWLEAKKKGKTLTRTYVQEGKRGWCKVSEARSEGCDIWEEVRLGRRLDLIQKQGEAVPVSFCYSNAVRQITPTLEIKNYFVHLWGTILIPSRLPQAPAVCYGSGSGCNRGGPLTCLGVSWLTVGSARPLLGGASSPPHGHSSSSRLDQACSRGGGRARRERAEAAKSFEV